MHPNTGKTPRGKARAPDRSVKDQLFGRSPPPPRFVYGKRGRISSNPGSPSRGTNRLTSAPPFSLELDYEEPRLIPDTEVLPNDLRPSAFSDRSPSLSASDHLALDSPSYTPLSYSDVIPFVKANPETSSPDQSQIRPKLELEFSSNDKVIVSSVESSLPGEVSLKEALDKSLKDLDKALEDTKRAEAELKALREAEEHRNNCC
ncbi:hypothetical protein LENED_009137 [Lentinula edodes]|uniref:Uncharacterized protein n=1 Tax=Lentinula edodes TaxID=5353 RepID=A0A1Q3EJ48_LENED|nr:hypothetical protein LENED_009137 [Lentinula edodes]